MTANPRNLLLFGLLTTGALVTWFFSRVAEEERTVAIDTAPIMASYYLLGATLYGTDDAGATVYRIEADRVEQQGQGDDVILDEVRVKWTPESGVFWDIYAKRGETDAGRRVLDLQQEVRAVYTADSSPDQTVVEAIDLHLDMDELVVSTDQPVKILSGRTELEATRLVLDLQTDDLLLGSAEAGGPNVTIRSRR